MRNLECTKDRLVQDFFGEMKNYACARTTSKEQVVPIAVDLDPAGLYRHLRILFPDSTYCSRLWIIALRSVSLMPAHDAWWGW